MEKNTVSKKARVVTGKEKAKAVRTRRIRRQGEQTEGLREKNDDLLYRERDVK